MKLPILYALLFVLTYTFATSQNKQFLYGFEEIPQSLLENPGEKTPFNKHISIPFLSGIYIKVGTSNVAISELIASNSSNFEDEYKLIMSQLKDRDFVSVNQQLDLINVGYRLKNEKDYLSFGLYQELDFIAYHPEEAAILYYHGNTDGNGSIDLNRTFAINDIRFKAEIIGVLHAGISRKISDKLQVGVRAKIYSGGFNVQSLRNKGTISSRLDQSNNSEHLLSGINLNYNSSGLTGINREIFAKDLVSNMLVGGNLGLGLDFGFTYRLKNNINISGSVLDLGFISYSKNVTSYKIEGDVVVTGISLFDPPATQTSDYWDTINIDLRSRGYIEEKHSTYLSYRSPKVNATINYRFGKEISRYRQTSCATVKQSNRIVQNEFGVQLYSIFRPKQPQLSTTLYYSRTFSKFLKTKITYTADTYSFTNIGLGFSTQLGIFNIYAAADNLLGYKNMDTTKKLSLLFGMNFIFK